MRRSETIQNDRATLRGWRSCRIGTWQRRGLAFCAGCQAFEQGVADSTLIGLKEPDELLTLREYALGTLTAMMYLEGLWRGAIAVEG